MQQSEQERRTMRRFDMRLPAAVRLNDLATLHLQTETQNVSARGVFFYLDRIVEEGSRLEMTLTFPPSCDPDRLGARALHREGGEGGNASARLADWGRGGDRGIRVPACRSDF